MEEMLLWHKALERVGVFQKSTMSPAFPKVPNGEGSSKLSIIHHLAKAVPIAQSEAHPSLLETSSP